MGGPAKTLGAYVNEVIEEYVIAEDGEQVILDVSSEEAEELGLFFIRGMVGFLRGLKRVRFLRELAHPAAAPRNGALIKEESAGEEGEVEEPDEALMN